MCFQPNVLEYAFVVKTASSTHQPGSSLRVKYTFGGRVYTTALTMAVGKFAEMIEDQADFMSYIKNHADFVKLN